jgi:hypothetical protein
MSDIVDRLRNRALRPEDRDIAADEIERLRSALREVEPIVRQAHEAEVERLRAKNKRLKETLVMTWQAAGWDWEEIEEALGEDE